MSDIVMRLRRKTIAGMPVFPTPIEMEAADRIEQLEAALRLYWEAKTPAAMGAADAVAARLLTPIVAPKEPHE